MTEHGDILRLGATITTRTALVGGGAQGIGRATAERLADDGLTVIITGRHEDALIAARKQLHERTGTRVEYLVSDISEPGSAATTVRAAQREVGPIDVLVLNAGGPPPGRILAVDDATWQAAFQLLLLGPLGLARAVLPGMAERGFGRIVAVTSTAARQPQADLATSVVLRSALTSAVNLLSREHAAQGVTVNCVAPGATDTERRRAVLASRARATGASVDELDRDDVLTIPAGRPGQPAEIAAAISFLVSDAAGYINGTVLTVDGGRTETI